MFTKKKCLKKYKIHRGKKEKTPKVPTTNVIQTLTGSNEFKSEQIDYMWNRTDILHIISMFTHNTEKPLIRAYTQWYRNKEQRVPN